MKETLSEQQTHATLTQPWGREMRVPANEGAGLGFDQETSSFLPHDELAKRWIRPVADRYARDTFQTEVLVRIDITRKPFPPPSFDRSLPQTTLPHEWPIDRPAGERGKETTT